MKQFLILYKAPVSALEKMQKATPEEGKKGMEAWMAWAKKCGTGIVNLGAPLGNAHTISSLSHGKSESTIAGYSLMQAESWEELKKMIDDHPHLMWMKEASIEIHECLPLSI